MHGSPGLLEKLPGAGILLGSVSEKVNGATDLLFRRREITHLHIDCSDIATGSSGDEIILVPAGEVNACRA